MTKLELGSRKIRPIKNKVAFSFHVPEKSDGGILLPETYYAPGLRLGKIFVGNVIAVGSKVNDIMKGEKFLLHEYSGLGGAQEIKRDNIYFIEEDEILAKVDKAFIAHRVNEGREEKRIENSKEGIR